MTASILTILASGSAALHNTVYVAPDGSDLNNGQSAASPLQSLERARQLAAASADKTIISKSCP